MDFVAFCSYGNDSIAMLQLLHEYRLPTQRMIAVVYSDTGWASEDWEERVARGESWAEDLGFFPARTSSEGFADLVRRKKIFPRGRAQFCTEDLKIRPAMRWMAEHDPSRRAVCVNGVRRAESLRRADTPVFMPISDAHGGRPLWSPLAEFNDESRNVLIERAGFEVLPHRSDECSPCIFSSRADLRRVTEQRWGDIKGLEGEIGPGRTMFRAKAYAGAEGADEVRRWAESERGKFRPTVLDDDEGDCDSGYCGS